MNLISIMTFVWVVIAALGLGATALIVLQCARASPAASVAAPALSVRLRSPERKCLPRRPKVHGAVGGWQEASVGSEADGRPAAQCAAVLVQRLRLSKMQMLPPDDGVLSARLATGPVVVGVEILHGDQPLSPHARGEHRHQQPGHHLSEVGDGQDSTRSPGPAHRAPEPCVVYSLGIKSVV